MKKRKEEEMNKSGECKERLQRERKIKIKKDIKRYGRKAQTNKKGIKSREKRDGRKDATNTDPERKRQKATTPQDRKRRLSVCVLFRVAGCRSYHVTV